MKIEDYKNAVNRIHMNPELEAKIIDSSVEKNNRMHMNPELEAEIIDSSVEKNKRKLERGIVFIAGVATICLSAFIVIFAVAEIFGKTKNFETKNTVEQSIHKVVSDEAASINILKATHRKMDASTLKDIFNKNDAADNNTLLYYGDGNMCWQYGDNYDYSYSMAVFAFDYNNDYGETYNGVVFEDKEISGLDKSECIALADSYIEKLDISVSSNQVYALDLDVLVKTDTARNENGERIYQSEEGELLPEWTEDQEAYLIVYTLCVDDILLSPNYNQVSVVVGRNGLAYFEAYWIYDTLDIVETVEICSAEEAIDVVYEHFDKDIPTDSIDVNKCRLIYIPEQLTDETYILKPYWEFDFDFAEFSTWLNLDGITYEFNYSDTLIVDAQTRKLDVNDSTW